MLRAGLWEAAFLVEELSVATLATLLPLVLLLCSRYQAPMPLPAFDTRGDLPVGVHPATLTEVQDRFGHGPPQRNLATTRLLRVYELAKQTGKLLRFVIFGSYVTAKPEPNDVDIILVMTDDFEVSTCDEQTEPLFDHLRAQQMFGASVFSVRPSTTLGVSIDEFIAYWQIKRDQSRHGIVEVVEETSP